jgi:CheY-like chemotaxis protein
VKPVTNESSSRDDDCVLIVDDECDIRESLRDVVEMGGCSALLAASAEEALALLADHRPCLVVLDLLMPGMTGLEMLEKLRAMPEHRSTQVIVSTSAPERAPRGVPLLPKPIDIDALWNWMRRVCHCSQGLISSRARGSA